jgi:hypothetical protein
VLFQLRELELSDVYAPRHAAELLYTVELAEFHPADVENNEALEPSKPRDTLLSDVQAPLQ